MDNCFQFKMMTKQREIRRQIFHIILGLSIVVLYYTRIMSLFILGIIIIVGIIISIAWKKNTEPIISWFLSMFERNGQYPGWGALWFCIGSFVVLLIFTKEIALASIMILALGDAVSHICGRFYGKIKHKLNKNYNIEGTIAGIIVASFGALLFVPVLDAVIAATIAMNCEVVNWRIGKWCIDDNFIIPIVAALTLFIVQTF